MLQQSSQYNNAICTTPASAPSLFLLATQLERYELLLGLESALGKFENFYSASPAPFFWEGLEGLLLAAKPRLAAAANYFKIFQFFFLPFLFFSVDNLEMVLGLRLYWRRLHIKKGFLPSILSRDFPCNYHTTAILGQYIQFSDD